jgi:hypothetical protein
MTEASNQSLDDRTQSAADLPTEDQLKAAIASADHCFVAWRQTAPAVKWIKNELVPWPSSTTCS